MFTFFQIKTFLSLSNIKLVTCYLVIISQCSVVRCSICCVSCSIAVGENWETIQPTTGRDLWAHQVRQWIQQYLKCTIYLLWNFLQYQTCPCFPSEKIWALGGCQSKLAITLQSVPFKLRVSRMILSSMAPSTPNSSFGERALKLSPRDSSRWSCPSRCTVLRLLCKSWFDSFWRLGHLRLLTCMSLLCLCRYNEAYTWTNPTCCVHNIIVGQLWIEQYGSVEVLNHK